MDSGEIFWSDDDIEFLSSSNVQIVTVASDSDSADCKIRAVNLNAFSMWLIKLQVTPKDAFKIVEFKSVLNSYSL